MCARSTISSSSNEAAVTEKIKQVEEGMKAQMEAALAKLNQKWARRTKSLKKCLSDIYQRANLDPPEGFFGKEGENEIEDVGDSDSDEEYQNVDGEGDSDDDNDD